MMTRLLTALLFALPSLASASVCSNLAVQINRDIVKYDTRIANQQLPWMNLNWLKKQLGEAQITKVAPEEKEYKWVCQDNSSAYIAVTVNNRGVISNIEGVYNTDTGSGMMSACLDCRATEVLTAPPGSVPLAKEPPKPAVFAPSVSQSVTTPQSLQVCSDVLKQIRDIAAKGSSAEKSYAWESLDWLQKNFGAVNLQQSNNVSGYEWKCGEESIMYFMKDKDVIYGAAKCANDKCLISYVTRIDGIMKGFTSSMNKGGAPQTTP